MTADVPFYVERARSADGPLVELAVGNGRVAVPVALATGRPVIGIDSSPAMLDQARTRAREAAWSLTCARATRATSHLTSRRRLSTARSARSCTCRPGLTGVAPSNASPPRCGRGEGSQERLCLRPQDRRPPGRTAPGRAHPPHDSVFRRGQPDRYHARRRCQELALVGHEERVAWAPRRRRPAAGGALRRLRRRAVRRGQPGVRLRRAPVSRRLVTGALQARHCRRGRHGPAPAET